MKRKEVFKYCTPFEKFIDFAGRVAAFLNGCSVVLYALVIGKLVSVFDPRVPDEEKGGLIKDILWYSIGISAF